MRPNGCYLTLERMLIFFMPVSVHDGYIWSYLVFDKLFTLWKISICNHIDMTNDYGGWKCYFRFFLLEEWMNTVVRVVMLWMIMTVANDKTKIVAYSADAAVCGTCNENNYQQNSIFVKNLVNLLLKATMACMHSVILVIKYILILILVH